MINISFPIKVDVWNLLAQGRAAFCGIIISVHFDVKKLKIHKSYKSVIPYPPNTTKYGNLS